jgi:putative transposase
VRFSEGEFYHLYNRGNRTNNIFLKHEDYVYFLDKVKGQILPYADIVVYTLMPNHFHFILRPKKEGLKERPSFGGKPMQELAYRIGILLSSYSQTFNKKYKTRGSLFQQKTKAKLISEEGNTGRFSYLEQCFHYIHKNPVVAGLVSDPAYWQYSSYSEYLGLRTTSICTKDIFLRMFNLTDEEIRSRTFDAGEEFLVE